MCKFNPKNDSRVIDPCMINLVQALKNSGFDIKACCCGHFKYSMTIVYYNEVLNKHFDLMTLKDISRGTKFYKKDKQGYYYIPEV